MNLPPSRPMNKHGRTKPASAAGLTAKQGKSASDTSSSSSRIVATPSTISLDPEDERDMDNAQPQSVSASSVKINQEQQASPAEMAVDQVATKQGHSQAKKKEGKNGGNPDKDANEKSKGKGKIFIAKKKKKKNDSLSDDSDEEELELQSESESEDEKKRRKVEHKKAEESSEETERHIIQKLAMFQLQALTQASQPSPPESPTVETESKKSAKGKLEYKRIDQVWDKATHGYKYIESAEAKNEEHDAVFTIRRKFDTDNKYMSTWADIKSQLLQEALREIMKNVKSVSLVEESPQVDPDMLFLYYDELKAYCRKTLEPKLNKERKIKYKNRLTQQLAHCKLLASYIDKDYEKTRKRLNAMVEAGNITFDLIWALFKPNTIAYTSTYGNKDDPRCFKVDATINEVDRFDDESWTITGRYLDYDGKGFGFGKLSHKFNKYKGPKKITSLETYPLSYHKDADGLRKGLVVRGKEFIALQGMNYRFHKGLAYEKRKKTIARHNIDGRVMVDPAIFRRINPNYKLSSQMDNREDELDNHSSSSDISSQSGSDDSDSDSDVSRVAFVKDKKGKFRQAVVPSVRNQPDLSSQHIESIETEDGSTHTFTEEELLIASPVVLGFAFSEKRWVEFSLSGIKEIQWNSNAFNTLVLPKHVKQNLKGLVTSHRFNGTKTIDDVIRGKGKGLNVMLHGPPGVGKTLTGESIADFLQLPLYSVSAGELGTNPRKLEADLNRIMDITHSWGAILLLDEADVFLEQRQVTDIQRNSLVSVFLRLLEYYQGILFLTSNRVKTFDEAFQSRIHLGIRYEDLNSKARKEIWMHHVRRIEALEDQESVPFKDSDFEELSRKVLNGRQIKNMVITAQSIALAEGAAFSMAHVKSLMGVQEDFEATLKGGRGYLDAMQHYA